LTKSESDRNGKFARDNFIKKKKKEISKSVTCLRKIISSGNVGYTKKPRRTFIDFERFRWFQVGFNRGKDLRQPQPSNSNYQETATIEFKKINRTE